MKQFVCAALTTLAPALPLYGCAEEVNTGDLNTDIDPDRDDDDGDLRMEVWSPTDAA